MKNQIPNTLKVAILENIPITIAFHDLDYNIRWANNAYLKATDLSLEEITGRKCYSVWGHEKPCPFCPVQTVIKSGKPAKAEMTLRNQIHWPESPDLWLIKSIPIKDEYGKIIGMVECAFETAARKYAELALQKSEASLREAQRLAHIGSWELDLKTDVLSWSDESYRIFEIEPSSYENSYETFLEAVHPDDREWVDKAYKESVKSRIPYSIEHRVFLEDGGTKFVHDRCKTYYNETGTPVRSIGTVQDITERKEAEKENQKLQAQYVQAQKMESVGRLAGGVAHDFNNMLVVILGQAELALNRMDVTPPLHDALMEIRNAAQRSADLTRQLLAFARRQIIAPKLLDLNETIGEILKMLERLIGESIDLAWIPGVDLGTVKMDPAQIDQILANLCVNARDAIAGVGKITIETHNAAFDDAYCSEHYGFHPGSYVMLAVSDNGVGMNEETLNQIFEPFFTSKDAGKGTGLGLATVYGIVKQNNGFINVYSEPGGGTVFKIYLSRHESGKASNEIEAVAKAPAGGGETILLVEDEAMVLKLGRKMLETFGYRVLDSNSPVEALRMANAHGGTIDLLITDVVMPEMTGQDLAVRIRDTCPGIKILYISGYTANVIAHHGVLQEDVMFLQKPFSKDELALKVREALEMKSHG